jgi:hypothetical protein
MESSDEFTMDFSMDLNDLSGLTQILLPDNVYHPEFSQISEMLDPEVFDSILTDEIPTMPEPPPPVSAVHNNSSDLTDVSLPELSQISDMIDPEVFDSILTDEIPDTPENTSILPSPPVYTVHNISSDHTELILAPPTPFQDETPASDPIAPTLIDPRKRYLKQNPTAEDPRKRYKKKSYS